MENAEVGTEPGWCGTLVGGGSGGNDLDWLHDAEAEGHERWGRAEEPWPGIGWQKKHDQL